MKNSFVDIHHHLAYGMDDGPKNRTRMFGMLDRAADNDIKVIIATPHATPGIKRFDYSKYRAALDDAREYIALHDLNIRLYEGCEILYTQQTVRMLQEGKVPTLAGTDFVLVEFSPDIKYRKLYEAIERLADRGYRPVIAHIERYRCLTVMPSRAINIKNSFDVFYQVNCSSVIEDKGFFVGRFLRKMLKLRMIDIVATDSHNTSSRQANMKRAWKALRGKVGAAYAKHLTDGSMIIDQLK